MVSSTTGFMVSVVGGILDFASATALLVNHVTLESEMARGAISTLSWVAGLYLLGVAVIATAVFSVMSVGIRLGKLFSFLMMAYGLAMVTSGWAMTSSNMLGTMDLLLYGYGMLVVGALMLVNGITMMRSPMGL